jgi:hypothetical protein
MTLPATHSSLPYALVRDFAYPPVDPMHYGTPPDPPSGATTPASEWTPTRRLSDPSEGFGWPAPSWNTESPSGSEALPSTSFGESTGSSKSNKHRKSRSYASISDWERGRRRESGSAARRSRTSGDASGNDMFHFGSSASSQTLDPAGSGSLRHSRTGGSSRRDSHFAGAATLPNRSFHSNSAPQPRSRLTGSGQGTDEEDPIPLDTEASTHAHSPQRASMGPEDELFAGESLALYAFEPENANELRLKEGQIILVSYRHGQGWLVAEDPRTGEQGLVPEEYVRLVREIEGWDVERGDFIDVDGEGEGDTEMDDADEADDGTETLPADDEMGGQDTEDSRLDHTPSEGDTRYEQDTEPFPDLADPPSQADQVRLTASPPAMDERIGVAQQVKVKAAGGEMRQDSAHADR